MLSLWRRLLVSLQVDPAVVCLQARYGNTGRLLAIQIDAAINSGNSGGPAFADIQAGKVAGRSRLQSCTTFC